MTIAQIMTIHNKNSDDDDNLFDVFICQNFVPFSGTEQIDQWLDEIESLFNRFKISRKFRSKAIPLLVQGEPKRKYIKNRQSILSFDDFYEFLFTHFDNSSVLTSNSKPSQLDGQAEVVKNLLSVNQLSSELKSNVAITTNSSQVSYSHSCDCCCNKNVVNDATRVTGDVSV